MNVVELCLSYGHGGLEMYPHKVMQWLLDEDHPCIAVVRPGTPLATRLEGAGIPCAYLRVHGRHLPLIAARRLASLLEAREADILHIHWAKDLLLAVLAKRFCRRRLKLVYTRQMGVMSSKHDRYHRFVYRHVDRYIVITKRLQEEARRFLPLPPGDIRLLYYGVPDPPPSARQECPDFLNRSGLEGPGIKVGLFGRIAHVKGQHLLGEAVEILMARACGIRAALIGGIIDQVYFDGLMDRIETSGLSDRLKYLGFIEDPISVMGCFDVVVLTTYTETFGLVIAEAMRAGTAVIGTNAGGVPEMIEDGETGLLFEEGDAAGLADAIQRLATDPSLRARLAASGKAFADEHFSEPRHFEGLRHIFESVLSD
ncbi:MAG: glycosyltransferase family 4 protein [Candidatus Hydrogenedentes bacterium]|nr:glycosyltransferase family 4 protein [Candidatus Hydrogenedentota bacterium]